MTDQYLMFGEPGRLAKHPRRLILAERRAEKETERLQCFSQPASLITCRRRQRSNVEDIKTVQNELENLHMILLCKKGSHGVCVRGKQRSIPLPNCLESWTLKNHVRFICNSHTTTMSMHWRTSLLKRRIRLALQNVVSEQDTYYVAVL